MVSGFSSAHNRRSPRSRYAMSNDGFFDAHSKQHLHRLLVMDKIMYIYAISTESFQTPIDNNKTHELMYQWISHLPNNRK